MLLIEDKSKTLRGIVDKKQKNLTLQLLISAYTKLHLT